MGVLRVVGIAALVAAGGRWLAGLTEEPEWPVCPRPDGAVDRQRVPSDASEITLRVEPGHALTIPRRAASPGTEFVLRTREVEWPSVEIEMNPPADLAVHAELRITYTGCTEKPGSGAHWGIWRLNPAGRWRRVGGRPVAGEAVAVRLKSFSTYALATN